MSDGVAEFLAARLVEDEKRANAMQHDAEPPSDMFYWCPAALPGPLGDLPFGEEHCDCGLAERKARAQRHIGATRELLYLAADQRGYDLPEGAHDGRDEDERQCDEALKDLMGDVLRIDATRWSDHPEYRQEWKP